VKLSLLAKGSALLLLSVIVTVLSCGQPTQPVKIGFVGALTGRYSDLGVCARDGVILAVEEKNRLGGLLGRPLELLTRDDMQDPEVALQVDQDLIDSGVIAIIGHMTSEMSKAALPLINRTQTVMVSPTTASPLLSGKTDFFFRVYEPVNTQIEQMAGWAGVGGLGLTRMVAVYDLNNPSYSQYCAQKFERVFKSLTGQITSLIGLSRLPDSDIPSTAEQIKFLDPDGVFLALNSIDTSFLLQQLRSVGWSGTAMASPWSMTEELLEDGARGAEGLHSIVSFLPDHPSPRYRDFRKAFLERFKREPGFPAVHAYEAAEVIFQAFEKARAPGKPLADAILEIREFEGLQSMIVMDEYGDPIRESFRVIVKEGRMETVR
jgi:branched-chain amino acid transport system substrate-binding protein